MRSLSYEGIFCWLDEVGHHKEGPFCVPCSTRSILNKLTKLKEGQWQCIGCGRIFQEGESPEHP